MSPQRTEGQNESASVWQGLQVHPDQTKAVKGQNSKTLVTACTIKRPLPPCKRDRKTEDIFHKVKRKTEQEEKEKR